MTRRADADDEGRRAANREHRFAHARQWSDASLEDMRDALDFRPPILYGFLLVVALLVAE